MKKMLLIIIGVLFCNFCIAVENYNTANCSTKESSSSSNLNDEDTNDVGFGDNEKAKDDIKDEDTKNKTVESIDINKDSKSYINDRTKEGKRSNGRDNGTPKDDKKFNAKRSEIPPKILNIITRVKSKITLLNMIDRNLVKIIILADKTGYGSEKLNDLMIDLKDIRQGYKDLLDELQPIKVTSPLKTSKEPIVEGVNEESDGSLTEHVSSGYLNYLTIDKKYISELWNVNNQKMKRFIIDLKLELISLKEYFVENKKNK